MSDDFLDALQEILQDQDVPQETINRIAVALALDAGRKVHGQEARFKADFAALQALVTEQSKQIALLSQTVATLQTHVQQHPSLLYLLRFRTRQTVSILILLFLLLSLLWLPEIRRPLFNLLQLPHF